MNDLRADSFLKFLEEYTVGELETYTKKRNVVIEYLNSYTKEAHEFIQDLLGVIDTSMNSLSNPCIIELCDSLNYNGKTFSEPIQLLDIYLNTLHGTCTLYGYNSYDHNAEEVFRELGSIVLEGYEEVSSEVFDEAYIEEEYGIEENVKYAIEDLLHYKTEIYLKKLLIKADIANILIDVRLRYPVYVCLDIIDEEVDGPAEGIVLLKIEEKQQKNVNYVVK